MPATPSVPLPREPLETLRSRCRTFTERILRFARTLPSDVPTEPLARQLARAGAGASANYHAACRARSRAEFIAWLSAAHDEAESACAWLAVIREGRYGDAADRDWLDAEARALRALFAGYLSVPPPHRPPPPPSSVAGFVRSGALD